MNKSLVLAAIVAAVALAACGKKEIAVVPAPAPVIVTPAPVVVVPAPAPDASAAVGTTPGVAAMPAASAAKP